MPIDEQQWQEADSVPTIFEQLRQFFNDHPEQAYTPEELSDELKRWSPEDYQDSPGDERARVIGEAMAASLYDLYCQILVRDGLLERRRIRFGPDEETYYRLAEDEK